MTWSFKSSLILLGILVGEPATVDLSECFCARGCTKGLVAMLHVTLDLFWIFSLLFQSLFITLCITKSSSPLSNQSFLMLQPFPWMLMKWEGLFAARWDYVSCPFLFSPRAAELGSVHVTGQRTGNKAAWKCAFSLEKERGFPWSSSDEGVSSLGFEMGRVWEEMFLVLGLVLVFPEQSPSVEAVGHMQRGSVQPSARGSG